ncbi:DUF2628 domain-containing protein [Gordonia sp. NPDC003950]
MTNVGYSRSPSVPSRWQTRFAFYDAHGNPADPAGRAVFRVLPFGRRMRLSFNVLAFLFGPIYFAVKGMWRKGLTLLAIGVAVGIVMELVNAPAGLNAPVAAAMGALAGSTANYSYYLHIRANSHSWNPFEGMSGTKRGR